MLGYRVEAIEPLDPSLPCQRSAELLIRGRFPASLAEWWRWYALLPDLTRLLCERHKLDSLHVNVSTKQLLDPRIRASLNELDPERVALEWVEDLDPDLENSAKVLTWFRSRGHRVLFDDVGAGEDMMCRVAALDPDEVKIHGRLMIQARRSPRLCRYLARQIDFFHRMSWLVTMEWIETDKDLYLATQLGADRVQGFFYEPVAEYLPSEIRERRLANKG